MITSQLYTRYSVKNTLWGGAILLGLVFASFTGYLLFTQYQAYNVTEETLHKHAKAARSVIATRNHLKNAVSELGLYLISQEKRFSVAYQQHANQLRRAVKSLKTHPMLTGNQTSVVRRVIDNTEKLLPMLNELLSVDFSDPKSHVPAMQIAADQLQPLAQRLTGLLDSLLLSNEKSAVQIDEKSLGVTKLPAGTIVTAPVFNKPKNTASSAADFNQSVQQVKQSIAQSKPDINKSPAPVTASAPALPVLNLKFPQLKITRPPKKAKSLTLLHRKVTAFQKQVKLHHQRVLTEYNKALATQSQLIKKYQKSGQAQQDKINQYQTAMQSRDRLISLYQREITRLTSVTREYTKVLDEYEKIALEYYTRLKSLNQSITRFDAQASIVITRKQLQFLLNNYQSLINRSTQQREITRLIISWSQVRSAIRAFLAYRSTQSLNNAKQKFTEFKRKLAEYQAKYHSGELEKTGLLSRVVKTTGSSEKVFARIVKVHMSPVWRRDIVIVNDKVGPVFTLLNKDLDSLVAFVEQQNNKQTAKTMATLTDNIQSVIALIILIFSIGLVVFLFSLDLIFRPLKQTIHGMRQIEEQGDLHHTLPEEGRNEYCELGKSFNRFIGRIRSVVDMVINSSNNLVEESKTLSKITATGHERAHKQEQEIRTVTSACSGMFAALAEIQKHTAETANATQQANDKAINGQTTVDKAVKSIESLACQVEDSSESIESLEEESKNIGEVVAVIRNITEQTNLLALNAAIEAARAGEQGRGFAVVADEVRALSRRVNEQTDMIQERIDALHQGVQRARQKMQQGRTQATSSVKMAVEAGNALQAITESFALITSMNLRIAEATEAESNKASQINANLELIAAIAQEAAINAQKTSAAGNEYSIMAKQLEELVAQFLLTAEKTQSTDSPGQDDAAGNATPN